jgi:hypothetical protein
MEGGGWFDRNNNNAPSATDAVMNDMINHMKRLRTELERYQERITLLNNALKTEKDKAMRSLKLYESLERITAESSSSSPPMGGGGRPK